MPQWVGSLGAHSGVDPLVWGAEPIVEVRGVECEAATEDAVKPTMAKATTATRISEFFMGKAP
jgi:hypothetical protein